MHIDTLITVTYASSANRFICTAWTAGSHCAWFKPATEESYCFYSSADLVACTGDPEDHTLSSTPNIMVWSDAKLHSTTQLYQMNS